MEGVDKWGKVIPELNKEALVLRKRPSVQGMSSQWIDPPCIIKKVISPVSHTIIDVVRNIWSFKIICRVNS